MMRQKLWARWPTPLPSAPDSEISELLSLFAAANNTQHAQLSVTCFLTGKESQFSYGKSVDGLTWHELGENSIVSARIALDASVEPPRWGLDLFWYGLRAALERARLAHQATLLANAMEVDTSAIVLFDHGCEIIYANTNADRLLSRQTETSLQATTEGFETQPLVGLLCRLADRIRNKNTPSWCGDLRISDGSILNCEVKAVDGQTETESGGAWIVLRSAGNSGSAFLESFGLHHRLSPREAEVLRHLVSGEGTAEMAAALGISQHTVRDHIKRLHKKTGASSRNELLSLVAVAAMSHRSEIDSEQ